jgi:cytochrome c556
MQRWRGVLVLIAGITGLSAASVDGASPEDGKAAFERREDTMKHMGRPLFLTIGRVVKGTVAYGPDTVTAAETVASLASTLDLSLFPPGSNVAESKMRPEIFAASGHVDQLIAAVQAAAAKLVPAVKTGDKAEISAAYATVADACNACHSEFRKEE